jgi:hypothetical protein
MQNGSVLTLLLAILGGALFCGAPSFPSKVVIPCEFLLYCVIIVD